MANIQSRIKSLELKLSPKIGLPVLILDCTSDECEVLGELLHRQHDETRAEFYDRVCAIYDAAPGIGMIIKIHAAEGDDDE